MIRIVLVGAAGRMGAAVRLAAAEMPDLEFKALVDESANRARDDGVWRKEIAGAVAAGDVVVDFSGPRGTETCAALCGEHGAALVSGTTGLTDAAERALEAASGRAAVLRASNFSLGVLALRKALRAACVGLPASWDVEVVERHHRGKADSPSGTAITLAADVRAVRGTPDAALRHGRQGRLGPRPRGEIGVHAVRGGTWVGDHEVLLAGEGEWLELRHVAQDRAAFAAGAIAAVRFVATAPPGLYTLEDVAGKVDAQG